jgi:hypothetical protein
VRSLTWCTVVLVALLVPRAVRAQEAVPTVQDTQLWVQLLGLLPVGDAWTVHAEAQFRWNDDVSHHDQDIFRGAVGRRINAFVTLWGGYAYTPRWSGGTRFDEQRTWEQASLTFPTVGKWASSLRIRQEQRYLADWGDTSHRLRLLGRVVRPIGASPWSVALWDEYMVTLDETEGGPSQGFDQNRVFAGVLRKLSADVTFEGGYLWQLQPSNATRGTRHGHTAFVWLTYAPPRK